MASEVVYLLEHWLPPGAPGSTGGTNYNYALVAALAKRCDVTVLALHAPYPDCPSGARLIRFSEPRRWIPKSRSIFWQSDLRCALGELGRPRLVLTTSATNSLIGRVSSEIPFASVIQAYEDFGWRVPRGSIRGRLAGLRRRAVTGQFWSPRFLGASALVVNSEFMGNVVAETFGCVPPMTVLRPPQMLDVVSEPAFSIEARSRVGFVNRVGKNLSFVLRLAKATPEREFLVFGHPVPEGAEIPKNVLLRGWKSDREDMYAEAMTWVMPSEWEEPFGMVAVEALSQGCRVGVSNRGGLPEAVGNVGHVFGGLDIPEWRKWLLSEEGVDVGRRLEHVQALGKDAFERRVWSWVVDLLR